MKDQEALEGIMEQLGQAASQAAAQTGLVPGGGSAGPAPGDQAVDGAPVPPVVEGGAA